MRRHTIEEYRSHLVRSAAKIFEESPDLPVRMEKICALFKVDVMYSGEVPRAKAYLRLEPGFQNNVKILLPEERMGQSHERFCIGHELAHLLLWRMHKAVPHGNSEYWQFEEICDEFARRLLMPESAVRQVLSENGSDAGALLRDSYRLANLAKAPWAQSARRISETEKRVNFFRIKPHKDERLRILFSTVPQQKERRRFIPIGTAFHESMIALLRKPAARAIEGNFLIINAHDLVGAKVPSFANACGGAALKGPRSDIRLAVIVE